MTKHSFTSLSLKTSKRAPFGSITCECSKSVGKVMSIIFFDTRGIVLNHMAPAKTTVNSEYYAHLIRVQFQRAIRDKRPDLARSGFILHQDNAPMHVSQPVKSTLQELGIKKPLLHPPYSPDLAICDFFLFPKVKNLLRGVKYGTRKNLEWL